MLVAILSWIYIFCVSLSIGILVNRAFSKIIPVPDDKRLGITGLVTTGLVSLTVYAETFSIFYKVGAVCHIIMLIAAIAGGYFFRKDIAALIKDFRSGLSRNKLILFVLIILAAAFFSSRGNFHTDTGIYHAQAIRLLEEYGCLKGLGNLQLHYAYNSAYLPLCALFTMSFIMPTALHTMTGFFMLIFTCYAVDGLMSFKDHRRHGGDFARIAILIYSLTNVTGLQSPATDYGTMFLVLYILCAFICYAEEKESNDKTDAISFYGFLAVLSIFSVSMKLSASIMVVLAVVPFVYLCQKKMWKELGFFILVGFLSFLPYMVRNVILSGWLFYPVSAIDLFNVVWKIPVEYMKHDSDQIIVWGRCLYDVTKVDEGISYWLPIWWEKQQHYEKMLIYSQIVGGFLLLLGWGIKLKKKTLDFSVVIFYLTVILNIMMWFVTAPFIRYGLAFLLILPLCAMGDVVEEMLSGRNLLLFGICLIIAINFGSWIDNYFTGDFVFTKHYLTAGYYVMPVPFQDSEMTPVDMNGQTVYVAGIDEVSSYYVYPGSCYDQMVFRTELIGSTIEEGFKAKDVQ